MFNMLVFVPIVCALVQLLAWSKFTLKDKKLKDIKAVRSRKERHLPGSSQKSSSSSSSKSNSYSNESIIEV